MMDCRTALEILDCAGPGVSGVPKRRLAQAEAHVAECDRCATTLHNRRQLDLKIGRMLRAVDVPLGAQRRLLAEIADRERSTPACCENFPKHEPDTSAAARKRRAVRGLALVAACVVIAAIGFFGAVWLFTPRWSVEFVSDQLAKIDFESLPNLPAFKGANAAAILPGEAAWQNLQWPCGQEPKALATAPEAFAIYGFVIPASRVRREPIHGLVAVIPRSRVATPPAAQSLSAASVSGYLVSRVGEWISISWTSGDVVCVCLLEGGADSLPLMQKLLEPRAA